MKRPVVIMRIGATLVAAALLGSCASPRPDLGRLYAMQENPVGQPPVIVIPGLLGSRIWDAQTQEEAWPGSLFHLLFDDFDSLRLQIDAETLEPIPDGDEVRGITDTAAGRDFYGRILEVLEDAGRYERTEPGSPVSGDAKRYYVFDYDWRQDNVITVGKLDRFIEQIRTDHGDPDLKVDIIAHSMGGLVTRYFIRYGALDVLNDNDFPVSNYGADRVRRAILLGTPNLGSVKSLQTLIDGFRLPLNRVPVEVVTTFPGGLQLLPHPLNDWLITIDGETLDRDHFEAEFWQRFEFALFEPAVIERIVSSFEDRSEGEAYVEVLQRFFAKHLERARRFVWSLTVPVPDPRVHYIVFGGDCHLTPARLLVEEVDGVSKMRLWPKEIRNRQPEVDYKNKMLEPGDGVVTKASLLARQALDPTVARHRYSFFPLDYAFFLCEGHDRLTGNINFQDNLLHVLLSADDAPL